MSVLWRPIQGLNNPFAPDAAFGWQFTGLTMVNLAVTGLECNTSLGGIVMACAAARAGVNRPGELDDLAFDEMKGTGRIIGHPVPSVDGFKAESRLLSLAYPALRDLVETAALHDEGGIGFLLVLPDLALRAKIAEAAVPRSLGLADRLASITGLSGGSEFHYRTFRGGSASFASAIKAGEELLSRREVRKCVVGAVDSLCDSLGVGALMAQRRIKTADNPVGLQPGEAAAFLLMELDDEVRRKGKSAEAILTEVAIASEPRRGDEIPIGRSLTQTLGQLMAMNSPAAVCESFFVVDLNGETERAADWGRCQQWLTAQMRQGVPPPQWTPAVSFGDTGTASGALALLMAIRALRRGYAPRRSAVILSAGEDGGTSAVRLERCGVSHG